jgi:predicted transcriptional regulator of viral defense system
MVTLRAPVDADLLRLRTEFATMPGLCLTVDQTARLLSVRKPKACALLDSLVVDGLLVRSVSGMYRRTRFR